MYSYVFPVLSLTRNKPSLYLISTYCYTKEAKQLSSVF